MGQVVHQAVVMQLEFCLYVAAGEAGLLYVLAVRIPRPVLHLLEVSLVSVCQPVVDWAYQTEAVFPDFVKREDREQLQTRFKFWQLVNKHVGENGCFVPLKLFKHAAQSFYSKTKAGVDGTTQQRAIMRSATSHLKWEQRLVSQIIKTLSVNAFIAWRMFERQDLLESDELFKSLDHHRINLNKVQATADFMFDASQDLLSYVVCIPNQMENEDGTEQPEETSTAGANRLVRLAQKKKRNRLTFFNSTDGVSLRLCVRGHQPVQGTLTHCALCGQHGQGYRVHRTSFKCNLCSVNLCLKVIPGFRKSCSQVWHSWKQLEARRIPAKTSSGNREGISTASNSSASGGSGSARCSFVRDNRGTGEGESGAGQQAAENVVIRRSSITSARLFRRRSRNEEALSGPASKRARST